MMSSNIWRSNSPWPACLDPLFYLLLSPKKMKVCSQNSRFSTTFFWLKKTFNDNDASSEYISSNWSWYCYKVNCFDKVLFTINQNSKESIDVNYLNVSFRKMNVSIIQLGTQICKMDSVLNHRIVSRPQQWHLLASQ